MSADAFGDSSTPRPRDEGASFHRARDSSGALHETPEIHRLLVATVRDYAIFAMDSTGHILTWNAGAERLKGYTAEDIIGRHFSIFYPAEQIARRHPWHELEIAEAEGSYEEEGWRLRKDGTRFWANVVITALHDEAGTLVGFAKVTRDLTERRAAELRRLEDARRVAEAEAANRAKSEFLATMSHELRTPLNAIGGYADLLTAGVHGRLNEPQLQALERVRASQQHLLTLISDLLDFSRIEAGRVAYQVEPVSLADALANVKAMIDPQAAVRTISVEWPEADPAAVAKADRARTEQIVLNLLTNAVKYTEPGGHVQVRHSVQDDAVVLEVEDDGIGIPDDELEAIFEPFTQVGRSLSTPHEGTGLGLAISRDLARAMGGDLTVRSTLGEGSVFTLTLPVERRAEAD